MTGVRTQVREAVLEVTLDRPPANAIDAATSRELGEVFARLREDPSVRVAILTALVLALASGTAANPIGTLSQKIHSQSMPSATAPPISGPATTASPVMP